MIIGVGLAASDFIFGTSSYLRPDRVRQHSTLYVLMPIQNVHNGRITKRALVVDGAAAPATAAVILVSAVRRRRRHLVAALLLFLDR